MAGRQVTPARCGAAVQVHGLISCPRFRRAGGAGPRCSRGSGGRSGAHRCVARASSVLTRRTRATAGARRQPAQWLRTKIRAARIRYRSPRIGFGSAPPPCPEHRPSPTSPGANGPRPHRRRVRHPIRGGRGVYPVGPRLKEAAHAARRRGRVPGRSLAASAAWQASDRTCGPSGAQAQVRLIGLSGAPWAAAGLTATAVAMSPVRAVVTMRRARMIAIPPTSSAQHLPLRADHESRFNRLSAG
jgi:hypothetical protein